LLFTTFIVLDGNRYVHHGSERVSAETFSVSDARAPIVLKLSSLFALDSFGGGFVVQSFAAYWFYLPIQRSTP
jgi:hypothetical protein